MLAVVAWWINNQWHSYGSPFSGGRAVKKPYNPILGEQFTCHWEDPEGGKTELLAEQGASMFSIRLQGSLPLR